MKGQNRKAVIVGGGPVGSLSAILLSKRGFQVELHEARPDIRKDTNQGGRSINLALSVRGISALNKAGLDKIVTSLGTPMHSRFIHASDGTFYEIPYGKKGQFLLSMDRIKLNKILLSAAEKSERVTLHFQQKLVRYNPQIPSATFTNKAGNIVTIDDADLVLGCDGAHSAVRNGMLRGRMDFSQMYIEHGYKELTIPPSKGGNYAMAPNHLHIWPRGDFMLIALPNLDKSFTCTMFMPFATFDKITTGEDLMEFFEKYFNDALPLIGEKLLKESFFDLPPLPLVTVRCDPYHQGNHTVLMGDAAHAVCPFYGQGLNAGLEDALVLDEIMDDKKLGDFEEILEKFSKVRVKAGGALADLSLYNYMEMRSGVTSRWYLLRKKVDGLINFILPDKFIPRYSMVTFSRIPYHDIIRRAKTQDKVVDTFLLLGIGLAILCSAYGLYNFAVDYDLPNSDILQSLKHTLQPVWP